jgi:CubicO group peptidase (beta-lactamase class C family)
MSDFSRLIPLLEHFTEVGPAGCGLHISQGGKTVFTHYAGWADAENQKPISADSIFQIHSNGKLITVVAAMKLFEKGAFLLNDPLEKYLPEYKDMQVWYCTGNNQSGFYPARNKIKINQLMNMTAGITFFGDCSPVQTAVSAMINEFEAQDGYTLQEFAKKQAMLPLLFDPGTSWCYSTGLDITAALIERLSGMKFSDYLRQEIFEPLGMRNTGFFLDGKWDRAALMYSRDTNGVLKRNTSRDYRFAAKNKFESGGGGMTSTLPDMDRFATMMSLGGAWDGAHVIGRKTVDLIRANHLRGEPLEAFRRTHANKWESQAGYGFGLGVRVLIDKTHAGSNSSDGEYGWWGAAGSLQMIDPQEELAVSYAHMLAPENNYEGYCHPRLRAAIYACLD